MHNRSLTKTGYLAGRKKTSELAALARKFQEESCSEATRKAYRSDWRNFLDFCQDRDFAALPADSETVSLFLTALADSGRAVSTIVRALTSVNKAHELAGYESVRSPAVLTTLGGIRRRCGKPFEKVKAITWADLGKMVSRCDSTIIGVRDRAVLLLGWSSALRRSELVALDIGDLDFSEKGIILTVRKSKTDQEGKGARLAIPYAAGELCPVKAVRDWLERLASSEQKESKPLFRSIGAAGRRNWYNDVWGRLSPRMISMIVKKYARACGLPPEKFASHSLRRGLATEAGARRIPERVIARHTRHISTAVLRGYIEEGNIWDENPLLSIYAPRAHPVSHPG
jgi:integrase